MKPLINKIVAVCMGLVVLMTTMSFTIDMHYCGKMLVDYSVFNEAKVCSMDKIQESSNCKFSSISQKSCCTNKQLIVEGQDDLKNSFDALSFEQQFFIAAYIYSYSSLLESYDTNIITFKEYSPPFLEEDIQVSFQTFLI